jgi:hypothetical protein
MFKCLKRFFKKPKLVKVQGSQSYFGVAKKSEYEGLNKVQIVTKACKEFEEFSMTFTSNMILKYLDGVIDYQSVYRTMHYLTKRGVLRKVNILSSKFDIEKLKLFYALNKNKND